MKITETNGRWSIITKTVLRSVELNFELGKEFEEVSTDGRKCKTLVTLEGNTLITRQEALTAGEKNVMAVRLILRITTDYLVRFF